MCVPLFKEWSDRSNDYLFYFFKRPIFTDDLNQIKCNAIFWRFKCNKNTASNIVCCSQVKQTNERKYKVKKEGSYYFHSWKGRHSSSCRLPAWPCRVWAFYLIKCFWRHSNQQTVARWILSKSAFKKQLSDWFTGKWLICLKGNDWKEDSLLRLTLSDFFVIALIPVKLMCDRRSVSSLLLPGWLLGFATHN